MDDKYETNMTTEMTADQVRSMGILRGYSHHFSMASLTGILLFSYNKEIKLNMSA